MQERQTVRNLSDLWLIFLKTLCWFGLHKFNPFISIKHKGCDMSSEGFSALVKTPWYVLRGLCCHPIGNNRPLQIKMAIWCTFIKIWTWWVGCGSLLQTIMAVWCTLNLKKVRQTVINYLPRAATPDQITRRIICRGQEGPKAIKSTLRPEIQANTWPIQFFKSQFIYKNQITPNYVTTRNKKKVVRKLKTVLS